MSYLWTLKKKFTFEAAHMLPNHDGKCARLHGHSWVGYVIVRGKPLDDKGPKQGMLLDYGDISAIVKPIVEQFLDHHFLNETLGMRSPTSERVAQWMWSIVRPKIPKDLYLAIEIQETCTSSCVYEYTEWEKVIDYAPKEDAASE